MTYWKFAPGERAHNWDTQRDAGYIGIGWHQLGNMINATRDEYDARRAEHKTDRFRNIWRFIHDINIGDIIIANRGINLIVGIGTVTGPATYVNDNNDKYPTRRTVTWDYVNNDGYERPQGQFAQATLTRIVDEDIIRLANQLLERARQQTDSTIMVTGDS